MQIRLISPGKVREKWLQAAIEVSLQRLDQCIQSNPGRLAGSGLASSNRVILLQEVPDMPDSWPAERALEAEGQQLLAKIKIQDYVVALDLHGKVPDLAAITLAGDLRKWLGLVRGDLVFVIGGSHGLAPAVLRRSDQRLCLSAMTWTHQMTRLVLLELLESAWQQI